MPFFLLPIVQLENHIRNPGYAPDPLFQGVKGIRRELIYPVRIPRWIKTRSLKGPLNVDHPPHRAKIHLRRIDIGTSQYPPDICLNDKIFS